jgi:aspartyl-tRNA synthetase
MNRTYIKDLKQAMGQEVCIKGWVDIRRDHGKLIFIDLRDATGKVQMVALPNHADAHAVASTARTEWVLEVTGKVNARPERMIKQGELNGELEIEILSITVLNKAETPVFDIGGDGKEINEEARLRHRYLDLRRERMQTGQSGRVVNYRTLCNTNATSPSFFVKYRADFLTQMTDFYKTTLKTFKEVAP